ncbi:MAG: ATP-binding protein [Polyangiaceae bacterium]
MVDEFAGRASELDALRHAWDEARRSPTLVWVAGAPGFGKSALVRRFAAELPNDSLHWVPCGSIARHPASIEATLGKRVAELGRGPEPDLLVVDALEHSADLEQWLFRHGLPGAGRRLMVVVTSRQRRPDELVLGTEYDNMRQLLLSSLSDDESRTLLHQLGAREPELETIVRESRGWPLLQRVMLETGSSPAGAEGTVLEDLLARAVRDLVEDVVSPQQRDALHLLCSVQVLDRELLQLVSEDADDAEECFRWLARLAFVEQGRRGLVAHDAIRSAAFELFSGQYPRRHAELTLAAARELLNRMTQRAVPEQFQLFVEALHTRRGFVSKRERLGIDALRSQHLIPANPDQIEEVASWLRRHEGTDGEALLRELIASPAHALYVVSNSANRLQGAICELRFDHRRDAAKCGDPVLRKIAETAALGEGRLAVVRWMLSGDSYYDPTSPGFTSTMLAGPFVTFANAVVPDVLACPVAAPERFQELQHEFGMSWVRDWEVEHQGHRYALFTADFGSVTEQGQQPTAVLRGILARRLEKLAVLDGLEGRQGISIEVLSGWLKEALPLWARGEAFARSEFAQAFAATGEANAARALLEKCVAQLQKRGSTAHHVPVLRATYFEDAPKQRAAAASLGIPYGTYRYRLRQAITALAEELQRHS